MPDNWASDFTDYSGGCQLPIFIGADNWVEYEKSGEYGVSPLFVCIGILYSWSEPEKWHFETQEGLDEFRNKVFFHLGLQTDTENLTELLITAAAWVRWNCGCVPSQRVLVGAMQIDPNNPSVSYDYVLDTWSLIERIPDVDLVGMCKSILSVALGIDLNNLLTASDQGQQNVNSVCYLILASLLLLGDKEEFARLFDILAGNAMNAPRQQAKLQTAAQMHSPTIDDLRIFTKG